MDKYIGSYVTCFNDNIVPPIMYKKAISNQDFTIDFILSNQEARVTQFISSTYWKPPRKCPK